MKPFKPSTTVAEIVEEMVQEQQGISMLTMQSEHSGTADFLILTAMEPYAEAIRRFVQMLGERIRGTDGGEHASLQYTLDEKGEVMPLPDLTKDVN